MMKKPSWDFGKLLKDKRFSIQFLPEILQTESTQKKILYKSKTLKSTYLIDIVHNLILKYYFKKENIFNLSSLILKEKYGYIYNYYIDYLVDKGVLILLKKHLKGKNARVYKLNDSVLKGRITRFKNEDKILLKKYRNAVTSIERDDIIKNLIEPEIKQKLVNDLFYIGIDYSKSIFFLDSTVQDTDIYNKNKYSVECIDSKHIFYHFDSYGRMHTNFTILKSFIRKNCLTIDGKDVFEFDIKNSQPLFLNKVIENEGINSVESTELDLFKYLTTRGIFYQYIMDNTNITNKKEIKECVYKVFFGKNHKNKYDTIFQKLFPSIYNFIKSYKKKYGDYKYLAHTLQNLESNLIFNRIIKEIHTTHPEIHLFTVHDSIVCSLDFKEVVDEIFTKNINDEFHIDLEPKKSIENNIYSYV